MRFPGICCGHCGNGRYFVFSDERRTCIRCATDEERALFESLNDRANAVGIRSDNYPYGPNVYIGMRQQMLAWAEANDLTYADIPHRCVTWLLEGSCRSTTCRTTVGPGWLDHLTAWKRDGRPAVLVAQPYRLDGRDVMELGAIEADARVQQVELRAEGSWYGFGTWFVGVWRAPR